MNLHRKIINKKIFLFLFILSCFEISFGQKAVVSFPNSNLIYKLEETPLEAVVAGYSCKNIIIKCPDAKIQAFQPCRYLFTPAKAGELIIDVFVIKRNDTILTGRQKVIIKERPIPEASLAGLKGGTIMKGNLKAQQGIGASFYVAGNHWESCTVTSYHVVILRDTKIIFDHFNNGNIFNSEVVQGFDKLAKGDKVCFLNISGCENQEGNGNLKNLEFVIDNSAL